MPTLRMPEVIRLFSAPGTRRVARFLVSRMPERFRWMYRWQVGTRFMRDERTREKFVPLFYEQLKATPSAFPPFFALTADLRAAVRSRVGATDRLAAFGRPVRVIFGAEDSYLNVGVAKDFHALFPNSELFVLPGAGHFPQLDEPEEVARLILSVPLAGRAGTAGKPVPTARTA